MLMLLSPAKTMSWLPLPAGLTLTRPLFQEQATALARLARDLTREEIARLMDLSDGLAATTWQRFQDFAPEPDLTNSRPAALLYRGDTYQGLAADTLQPADWAWAQDRLWILSGLYGLLRPLDLIQPYRLEMGVRLANPAGEGLYDHWTPCLTRHLNQLAAPVIINLASEEYARAVPDKALHSRCITPVFQEIRAGKPRVIGLLAKKARGRMARHIIVNRLEQPEALQAFDEEGYRHVPQASTPHRWVFQR